MKFLIVCSEFNPIITSSLLEGARDYLIEQRVREKNIHIVTVAGVVEIPVVLKRELEVGMTKYNGAIALGAVVRGSTPHFDYVCKLVSNGIQQVALEYTMPISFGILTTDNFEQVIRRCGKGKSNKGREAAEAVWFSKE